MAQLLGTSEMLWGGRPQSAPIKPVVLSGRWTGVALTVTAPPADNLVVWKALTVAAPGDALVIATGGTLTTRSGVR